MDQVLEVLEEKVEELVELPTDLLDKIGGGTGATSVE
jgi:hypothetical protein